jgi:hypothetical protein
LPHIRCQCAAVIAVESVINATRNPTFAFRRYRLPRKLLIREITKMIKKTTKRTLAISVASPATAKKPNDPAIIATIKNITAQYSIFMTPEHSLTRTAVYRSDIL